MSSLGPFCSNYSTSNIVFILIIELLSIVSVLIIAPKKPFFNIFISFPIISYKIYTALRTQINIMKYCVQVL